MRTNTPANLRRWERKPAAIQVSLVLRAEDFKVDDDATTVDISLRGVGVRTALALVPGEWVGVVAKGEFPHAIPTRVVWVREEESGFWTLAGLEFLVAVEV
ncbi:MAG: PilZ domain-containing protein [Terriglobia bacterium]|jgi:hypothetical protein